MFVVCCFARCSLVVVRCVLFDLWRVAVFMLFVCCLLFLCLLFLVTCWFDVSCDLLCVIASLFTLLLFVVCYGFLLLFVSVSLVVVGVFSVFIVTFVVIVVCVFLLLLCL